ncbi:ParA family protein [Cerasicoccus frondis]|uniref:ParA family protein n=1 Tax=Cerasicoccus frondis TaxID=490090 RepID=UPI002852B12C|nr:ParA family protein [Cerasicoccus frondis]
MPTKVFSIANQKGGVGKTTTAINLAVGLARRKVPTLLIDLDAQANATSGLGFEKEPGGSLYDALHGEGEAMDKVQETREKNLWIIPSEVDLSAIEVELGQKEDYLMQLKNVLEPVKASGKFSAIVLDCPPALGMISMNSLTAADYLLVALQCEYLALEGLGQILSVVDQLREAEVNPELEVGGILMTMYDSRTKLSKEIVDEVRNYRPDLLFKTIIPRTVRLSEAPSFGKSIFEYSRLNPGAFAYGKFAKEVIERFKLEKAS